MRQKNHKWHLHDMLANSNTLQSASEVEALGQGDFQVLNNYETRENSEIVVYRLYQSSTASNLQITSF